MYEQFRNQVMLFLSGRFSPDILEKIGAALDRTAIDYDIKKKETSLAIYNNDLPELVKTYLVCKKIEGLTDATLYNYRKQLHMFFLTVQKPPEHVTANDIRVYLYKYQTARKVSNRTLDKYREFLSNFFRWATDEGYLQSNPSSVIKPIKYEAKPRQALTQMDLEYMRLSCRTSKERAIIEVLYSTGCRVSELVGLKKDDIDWNTGSVHLFGKGNKHRTSFLNAKATVALRTYLSEREDDGEYLIVSDRKPHRLMHKEGVEKIIRNIARRASGHVNKHVTPHVFRHTTATTALQNGMQIENISKLLGHERVDTTMIYAKSSLADVQSGHKKYIV